MSTPNRLEDNWEKICPLILQQWPKLSDSDLQWTGKQFDKLVVVIRQRYGGRVEIIQEAGIRNTLQKILAQLES